MGTWIPAGHPSAAFLSLTTPPLLLKMSSGAAYLHAGNGYTTSYGAYAPQQYPYPTQQYYPAADQNAYYAQQDGVGRASNSRVPSQPMVQSNDHASGNHRGHASQIPIVTPKPDPDSPPPLRAANIMRSFVVHGNNVHDFKYTGARFIVQLPPCIDPNWRLEVYTRLPPETWTVPNWQERFHGLTMPEKVKDFRKLLKMVRKDVYDAYTPLSALGVDADTINVHRGILPFEGFDHDSWDTITNCLHSPDGIRPTLGLLLAKMIDIQYEWHEKLINEATTVWHTRRDDPIWGRWAENPRLNWLAIRSIRRTLPDMQGHVYYFPELQLMPMTVDPTPRSTMVVVKAEPQ
ncbi:hypothetical protein PYCCODRAFT_1437238 [Trametes coccinea BRFM310]|uniref:Uncharacterized protein n=1 Tax=Trametes coccinea (strain BRFM310) TaxID=1353009 RepID=A0A1Y2IHH8_TRAC3|nr:hypothetical protein PYCCODRAFT_1437238 [Trametes coccinea BRFM310]